MKKIFTLSLTIFAAAVFAAGMKSNKVGNGSFPAAAKTTQDAYLAAQGIPSEDQARCAALGYPASLAKCPQTSLSIGSPNADQLKVGQTFALTVSGGNGVGGIMVNATGNCTSSGNNVTVTGPGACSISAYKTGAGAYEQGTLVNVSFATTKGVQTIQFAGATPTAMQTLGTIQLASSNSTGGPVTYSVADTSICAITNSTTLTAKTAGTCTVTASSPATANYEAGSAQASITISGQQQTNPVTASISPSLIGPNKSNITISGSGGNGTGTAQFTFTSLTPNVCTVSGATLSTASNPSSSTCTISVIRLGSGAYIDSSASSVSFSLDITPPTVSAGTGPFSASVAIDVSNVSNTLYTFQASDTNGPVIYSISPSVSGFSINSSTGVVTMTPTNTAGDVSLTLRASDQVGNYVERVLNVSKTSLSLVIDNAIVDVRYGGIDCPTWNQTRSSSTSTITVSGAVGNKTWTVGAMSPAFADKCSALQVSTNAAGNGSLTATPNLNGFLPAGSLMNACQVTLQTSSGQSRTLSDLGWRCNR